MFAYVFAAGSAPSDNADAQRKEAEEAEARAILERQAREREAGRALAEAQEALRRQNPEGIREATERANNLNRG